MKRNPLGLGWSCCVALAVAASFCAPSARAATLTWKPSGGGVFTAAGNWDPSVAPTSADTVVFSGTGGVISSAGSMHTARVDSGAYTFSHASINQSFTVDTFAGAALASTTFTHTRSTSAATWSLSVSGTTAFTGTFSDNLTNNQALNLTKLGLGLLDISGATIAYTGSTIVSNGTLRVSGAASGSGVLSSGAIRLGDTAASGLLELNGKGSDVTFARTLGSSVGGVRFGSTSAGGAGSHAGFGAVNGNVTINLNGGATIAWDNSASGGASGSFFRVLTLQLGTETSTHRTTFSNNLTITGDKTITADNGLAAIDGEFSGALSMVTGANAILTKDGAGTMLLSGTSSAFAGRLHVTEGKLLVSGSLATATTDTTYGVKVDAGATLGGGGSIVLSNNAAKMTVEGTLQAGDGFADKTLTLSTNLEMAADSILSFAIDGTNQSDKIALTGGTSWLFQANQKVQILDLGASDAGGQFALITGLTGFGSYDFSNWQVTNSGPLTGELVYIGSTLYYQAVPEPSTLAFAGLGLGALVLTFRSRKLGRF